MAEEEDKNQNSKTINDKGAAGAKARKKMKLGSTNEVTKVQVMKYKSTKGKKKALASPGIKIDLVSVKI